MGARGSTKVLIARQPVLIERLRIQKRRSRYQYLKPISGPKAETQSVGCRTALRISMSLIRLRAYCSKGERGSGRGGCPPRSRGEKKKQESRRFLCFPAQPTPIPPLPTKNKRLKRRLIQYGQDPLLLPYSYSQLFSSYHQTHPTHATTRKHTKNNHEKKQRSRYGAIFFTCMLRSLRFVFSNVQGAVPRCVRPSEKLKQGLLVPPQLSQSQPSRRQQFIFPSDIDFINPLGKAQ